MGIQDTDENEYFGAQLIAGDMMHVLYSRAYIKQQFDEQQQWKLSKTP